MSISGVQRFAWWLGARFASQRHPKLRSPEPDESNVGTSVRVRCPACGPRTVAAAGASVIVTVTTFACEVACPSCGRRVITSLSRDTCLMLLANGVHTQGRVEDVLAGYVPPTLPDDLSRLGQNSPVEPSRDDHTRPAR